MLVYQRVISRIFREPFSFKTWHGWFQTEKWVFLIPNDSWSIGNGHIFGPMSEFLEFWVPKLKPIFARGFAHNVCFICVLLAKELCVYFFCRKKETSRSSDEAARRFSLGCRRAKPRTQSVWMQTGWILMSFVWIPRCSITVHGETGETL